MAGFFSLSVIADEGMWLPQLLQAMNESDMQAHGLQMTAEDLYSVNNSSLKDAIVSLNGGSCTAEMISSEGLMLTNHHCAFGSIQEHSSVSNDYLKDGFWAMSRDEELANEGLTASFLVSIEAVTARVLAELTDDMTEKERSAKIREISKTIVDEKTEGTHYSARVKSFFGGNDFYIMTYETFKDVRLVGAPPSSIGKFGGDTDNWMWPRHTGDFAIFRIYTAPDGSPAEYSDENIPLKPKHFLPINLAPVKQNEFSMIWGFPGGTERNLTSSGIEFKVNDFYPPIVEVFGKKLEVWKDHMSADQEVKIKYASDYAGIANAWKLFIGQDKGIKDLDLYNEKNAFEVEFQLWVEADSNRNEKYGEVLEIINKSNSDMSNGYSTLIYASISGSGGADLIGYAGKFGALKSFMEKYKEEKDKKKKETKKKKLDKEVDKLKGMSVEHFENYDMFTDEDVFAVMTKMYFDEIPSDMHPALLTKLVDKFKGDFSKIAAYVFEKSNLF